MSAVQHDATLFQESTEMIGIDVVIEQLAESEKRMQATVEDLKGSIGALEKQVAVLAAVGQGERLEREKIQARMDNIAEQLHTLIGAMSGDPARQAADAQTTKVVASQQAGNVALTALINERTLPLFALLIIVVILGVIIYAQQFGDAAIDHKLDRVPGLRHEVPQ